MTCTEGVVAKMGVGASAMDANGGSDVKDIDCDGDGAGDLLLCSVDKDGGGIGVIGDEAGDVDMEAAGAGCDEDWVGKNDDVGGTMASVDAAGCCVGVTCNATCH